MTSPPPFSSNILVKYFRIILFLAIFNLHSINVVSEVIKKWPLIDKSFANSKGEISTWETQKNGILVVFSNPECPMDLEQRKIINNIFQLSKTSHLTTYIIAVPSHESLRNEDKIKFYYDFFGDIPYIVDTNDYLAKQFRASRTPTIFVFNSSKKTLYSGGLIDPLQDLNSTDLSLKSFSENLIISIAEGKYQTSKENPAIGCLIKKESLKKSELK